MVKCRKLFLSWQSTARYIFDTIDSANKQKKKKKKGWLIDRLLSVGYNTLEWNMRV